MDAEDAASTAGVVACLALLVALVVPFVLVDGPETPVGAYYASGPVGVTGAGFIAAVLVVVFLSGRQGRSPPDTVAGVAVVAGVALLLVAVSWALAADEVVYSFPQSASWLEHHRWVVLALAAAVPASAGAYARAVL
ncbi:DUF7548 family protein [Candidatus Halobonum tyrrellensis]|uniref:Uncharacterized protein n=1 Tax=Candidatus Halobonum tyrrellensis G22 TaxID=1324957 RepID=V4HNF1_9EURY|nr:hypothetical protein [Candidatus Halobonum tyrrellensis]ESP89449.1 hypothetical protein K933_03790 [Candidatus Halobonum tyrrellensis G22]